MLCSVFSQRTSDTRRGLAGLKRFLRNQEGGLAVYAALSMPVVAGLVGFGLDSSVWYAMKRDVRGMADAAAVSAAHTKMQGGSSSEILAAAITEATRNGYDSTACNDPDCLVLKEVTNPFGLATETIQVTVRQRAPMAFSTFFIDEVFVAAYASSGVETLGSQCVLALDPTAKGAVTFQGTSSADVGCGVASNSDHEESIRVGGNATLTANPVMAHGGIKVFGGGSISSDFPLFPFSPQVADPYADFAMPALPGSCDYSGLSVKKNGPATTVSPSSPGGSVRICGEVDIKGEITFDPGIYFIDGGDFRMNAGAVVNATGGVTFVLTGSSPSDVGEWRMNGQAELTIEAPSDEGHPTKGMAIIQDPIAVAGGDNKINGGSDQIIDGVIYFPKQNVTFNGGSDLVESCVQIISKTVTFSGNSFMENSADVCEAVGVNPNGTGGAQQVILVR